MRCQRASDVAGFIGIDFYALALGERFGERLSASRLAGKPMAREMRLFGYGRLRQTKITSKVSPRKR